MLGYFVRMIARIYRTHCTQYYGVLDEKEDIKEEEGEDKAEKDNAEVMQNKCLSSDFEDEKQYNSRNTCWKNSYLYGLTYNLEK